MAKPSHIGQRIREARHRRQLTQKALGRKLGVASREVQHYEHGERLTLDRLRVIAAVLGVKRNWLSTGQGR